MGFKQVKASTFLFLCDMNYYKKTMIKFEFKNHYFYYYTFNSYMNPLSPLAIDYKFRAFQETQANMVLNIEVMSNLIQQIFTQCLLFIIALHRKHDCTDMI